MHWLHGRQAIIHWRLEHDGVFLSDLFIQFLVAADFLPVYYINSHCILYAVDASEILCHALAWLIKWSRVV